MVAPNPSHFRPSRLRQMRFPSQPAWLPELPVPAWLRAVAPRVVAVLVYALALHWSYASLLSPTYAYMGMTYREPDWPAYVVMLGAVLLTAALLPARITRVSDFVLWVVFLITAAPSALLAQYMETLPLKQASELGVMVLVSLLVIRFGLAAVAGRAVLPTCPLPPRLFFGALTLFALSMYGVMLASGSLSFNFLRFSEVYAVRADYKATLLTLPLMGYLVPVLQSVVNPVFIAYGIYCRRWLPLGFGVAGQVLIYLASGQKIVLLFVGAAVAVAWLFRRNQESASPTVITWVFAALVVAAAAFDKVTGGLRATPVFVQRFIVLPAALTVAHVWVFTDYPKLHFSTVLPFFSTDYSEDSPPAEFVGLLFTGMEGNNANVNFFGDGYMQFGHAGMLVEALAVLALLWAADQATRSVPLPLACTIMVMPALTLTNASVFTGTLTLGIGAAIALLFFLPTTEQFPRRPSYLDQARAGGSRLKSLTSRTTTKENAP